MDGCLRPDSHSNTWSFFRIQGCGLPLTIAWMSSSSHFAERRLQLLFLLATSRPKTFSCECFPRPIICYWPTWCPSANVLGVTECELLVMWSVAFIQAKWLFLSQKLQTDLSFFGTFHPIIRFLQNRWEVTFQRFFPTVASSCRYRSPFPLTVHAQLVHHVAGGQK
jgi:hypothetical protein